MGSTHFDTAASGWDKKSRRVQLAEKISTAIARLPLDKSMDAMELGCGTGLVGISLAPSLRHLTTIDTSRGMLDVLQEKITQQHITNITPLYCDILAEAYSNKHDLIFSSMTLHHIKETNSLLHRFAELLNPGGYLALADLVTEDGSFHDKEAKGVYHLGFDPKELGEILAADGFTDINSKIIHSISKPEGSENSYPVFLLTARKK